MNKQVSRLGIPDNADHDKRKRLVLGCGALVHDMMAMLKLNGELADRVDIQCLPAKLHNTPQLIATEVDKVLSTRANDYEQIFVAYGDCGTAGALDTVLQKYQAERIKGAHCYEFFAGSEAFNHIVEDEIGSFFLTDYLVRNFERLVIKGLGLDRYPELFDSYFKHYTQIIYLAQTDSPELQAKARQHAQEFGMNYVYRYTGIQGLAPILHSGQERVDRSPSSVTKSCSQPEGKHV